MKACGGENFEEQRGLPRRYIFHLEEERRTNRRGPGGRGKGLLRGKLETKYKNDKQKRNYNIYLGNRKKGG